MTNFRTHELMELWLQKFIQDIINQENPSFRWIQENLEAYRRIQKAIWQLPEEEEQ